MAFGNESPMAKKMAARKLFDEAEEAMGAAQEIIYGPAAAETGDAGCAPNQDDITPAPSRRCDDSTVFVSRGVQDRLDDSESRQERMYEQLARQQLSMDQMAASQAATNEMLSQLKSAVEMLSSAAISVSVSASDVRHDTDADTNVSADGNASQQPASVSPALQQGTAVPSNTDFAATRDAKNASSLASVSASDVSNDADYDVSADGDAFVSPALKQGTAAATAERYAEISASSCLQLLLRFKDHDPAVYSDSKLRWTTNGPSMYGYIKLTRAALCDALETAIENTGAGADKAIQVFVSAVASWLTPRDHSVTSILMEGLTYDQDSAAAADINRLVILSVLQYDDIEGLAAEIKATGKYDRSRCKGIEDIRELPGYQQFDPSTAEGSVRWTQMRRVFSAFFKIPVSATQEKEALRKSYLQHRQEEGTGMRSFISKDDVLFGKYERGGGQVTDQTRIEWMAQKISPASSLAMADHRKTMKSFGKLDPTLDTDWFRYSDVLIMICSDLTSAAVGEPAQAAQAPAQAPAQADKPFLAPRASGGRQLTRPQLQAIHRFAAANGKAFSNVALEDVEAAGGVEKWFNIPQLAAEEMYKAKKNQDAGKFDDDTTKPRVYPVLKKRSEEKKTQARDPMMFCMMESD